jgi:hypothetical protein
MDFAKPFPPPGRFATDAGDIGRWQAATGLFAIESPAATSLRQHLANDRYAALAVAGPITIWAMRQHIDNKRRRNMKKFATMIVLASAVSLASLAASLPASARSHRHHFARSFHSHNAALAGGYRSGRNSWFNVDRRDRASSPYAGGGGGM